MRSISIILVNVRILYSQLLWFHTFVSSVVVVVVIILTCAAIITASLCIHYCTNRT